MVQEQLGGKGESGDAKRQVGELLTDGFILGSEFSVTKTGNADGSAFKLFSP